MTDRAKELGARDGKRWGERRQVTRPALIGIALAYEAGEHHWRHMCAKRLAPEDAAAYGTAFIQAAADALSPSADSEHPVPDEPTRTK